MEANYKEWDKLIDTFHDNDEETFVKLLDNGADPNAYIHDTEHGKVSVLSNIVRKGSVNFVRQLLKHGADPNFQDEDGETPLFEATDGNVDMQVQELLYTFGADKNHSNKAGNSPLMQLAIRCLDYGYNFRSNTLFDLLDGCSDFHQTNSRDQKLIHIIQVVHTCILSDTDASKEHICIRFLKILLKNGLSTNTKDGSSLTPLHYAAAACCEDSVKFLIENGADIRARSISGQTPLHFLGMNSNRPGLKACLRFLLDRGCYIGDTDNLGRNILHYITSSNKVSCIAVEIMLQEGLNSDTKDKFGLSPLHLCVIPSVFTHPEEFEEDEKGKDNISDVLTTLIEHGASVNAMDKTKQTPLHYALRYEKKQEVVETLLKLGADVNLRTMTGETALHRSTLYPNLLHSVLKTCPAVDINARDGFGSTALHWAVYYFEPSCINQLLEAGADLGITDNNGRTPREYAILNKRTSLFKCLNIPFCGETDPLPCAIKMAKINSVDEEILSGTETAFSYKNTQIKNNDMDTDENTIDRESDSSDIDVQIACTGASDPQPATEIDISDSESSADQNAFDKLDEECIGEDHMFCDCPLLETLTFEDGIIDRNPWRKHCEEHKQSIASFIELILNSKRMGMYIDIPENDFVAESVRQLLQSIAYEIKNRFPIFECEIQLAGSWTEGTKIVFPDEFDFKWVLKHFSLAFEPIETLEEQLSGFVRFRLKEDHKESAFKDFVDGSNFLDGRKVVRAFYTVVNDVLFNQFAHPNLYPVKYLKTEKGSIDSLSFRWVECSYKNMLIDIDVVPTLTPSSWFPKSVNTSKSLLQKLELAKEATFSVVLKTPDSRFVRNWNTLFRISLSELEVAIFKAIPDAILKGYILVKSLPCTLYYPQIYMEADDYYRQPHITTYHFKTSFFHELEDDLYNVERPTDIAPEYTSKLWALKIVRRLSTFIDKDYLEPYFVQGVNLLANDSLIKFNNKLFYQCEIDCIKDLFDIGLETLSFRRGDDDFNSIQQELLKIMS